jgi:hypothetical protein
MKYFLLALLLVASVAGKGPVSADTTQHTVVLTTDPDQLEPGASTLIFTILHDRQPLANERVWMQLSEKDKIYFSGVFNTDEYGNIILSYYFDRPGSYDLVVEVDHERIKLPVYVHGQYPLVLGFFIAVFIVFALLLDKIKSDFH